MNNGYGNYNNNFSTPSEQNHTEPIILGGSAGGQQPPRTPGNPPPKKRMTGGLIAILLVICIAVSLCAGFGAGYGALLLFRGRTGSLGSGTSGSTGSGDYNATVLYQNVSAEVGTIQDGTVESVAAAVANSVVEITTESVATGSYFGQYVTQGAGSGVIVSADGYIATNNHVISGANTITVRLKDGTEYTAKTVGADSESDLVVIKVDASGLTPVVFGDSSKLVVGQTVIAVGNPLGSLGGTVTDGIISALDREITVDGKKMTLLQTDTAVNPGNSGGGLFNLRGELVGIVNAKSSGEQIEGIGFAIPGSTAYTTIGELIEYGYVRGRVDLGLTTTDITSAMQAAYYRVDTYGCYIISSKYTEDLKQGDRITAVNGTEVTYYADIEALKGKMNVGDTVKITVVRNGKVVDVSLVCREKTSGEADIDFET